MSDQDEADDDTTDLPVQEVRTIGTVIIIVKQLARRLKETATEVRQLQREKVDAMMTRTTRLEERMALVLYVMAAFTVALIGVVVHQIFGK